MRLTIGPAVLAATLFLPAAGLAEDAPAPTISIQFENDMFFDTDRHYTSGEALDYTAAPGDTPHWLEDFAHHLPLFDTAGKVRTDYQLAQTIFTPSNTQLVVPDPTDRPYAGYLYFGLGLLSNSQSHLDQVQLQFGVVGPAALGGDAQNWVHRILGQHKALGWHFQLRDEPIVNLFDEHSWKLVPPRSVLGLFFDFEPHAGFAVGNAYDYLNAGAMARLGINLPDDFGPPRLEPSLPGSSFFEPNGELSAYVFAGVDGRLMGRNIFLNGNTFEHSASVSRKILVGDLQIGATVQIDRARLSFTHVFRSKEFDTQPSADQFGSVSLTFRL